MKDLLTISDLTADEIKSLIELADDVKSHPRKYSSALKQKCIALIFQKTSTRTRLSFENGMYQLGGNAIYLDWNTTNLHLGDLSDEIKCVNLYVDLIMARVYKQETLEIMKKASKVPIINGLSDLYHPCQILADLMTIKEKIGTFEDVKVAWVGDGNNVCNDLILGCVSLNIPIMVATPRKYKPYQKVIDWVKEQQKTDYLTLSENPNEVVKDADIIYTDTFISMGQEAESEARLKAFLPKFQINKELLSYANKNPYIMHCLPAHRGIEITSDILDSENSIVFQQAENRLYAQKALMLKLLSEDYN